AAQVGLVQAALDPALAVVQLLVYPWLHLKTLVTGVVGEPVNSSNTAGMPRVFNFFGNLALTWAEGFAYSGTRAPFHRAGVRPGRTAGRAAVLRDETGPRPNPDGSAPVHPSAAGVGGGRDRGVRAPRRLRRRRGVGRAGEGVPGARAGGAPRGRRGGRRAGEA